MREGEEKRRKKKGVRKKRKSEKFVKPVVTWSYSSYNIPADFCFSLPCSVFRIPYAIFHFPCSISVSPRIAIRFSK